MPKHSLAKKKGKGTAPRGKFAQPDLIEHPEIVGTSKAKVANARHRKESRKIRANSPAALLAVCAAVVAALVIGISIGGFGSSGANGIQGLFASNSTDASAAEEGDGAASAGATKSDADKAAEAERKVRQENMLGQITWESLERIPDGPSPVTFSLNEKALPVDLDEKTRTALDDALLRIVQEEDITCGFVFLKLNNGQGIAFNANESLYSASAIKAPYVAFVLQTNPEELDEYDRENIEATITESDNDAYDMLHSNHDDQTYYNWLAKWGLEIAEDQYYYYPKVSAKQLAGMWVDLYGYISAEGEDNQWMSNLLSHTNLSFVRDGLGEEDLQVWNKAGWISDYDVGNAINDAAIIKQGDNVYLLSIVSTEPDSDEGHECVSNLVHTIWDSRWVLDQ